MHFRKVNIILSLLVIISKINCFSINSQKEKRIHGDDRLRMQQNIKNSNARQNSLEENTSTFWINNAKDFVEKQLNQKYNKNIAKNIIYFLGDGMSIATVAATRVYMGNENKSLSFEEFPHIGMVKTYCIDAQVADSACSGTAYLTGVKANYNTVGVNGNVPYRSCDKTLDKSSYTDSIGKWAMDSGKDIGVVTNTRITDASPANVYAHAANRNWENDNEIASNGCDPDLIDDIAEQLIHGEMGKNIKVLLGGGRREFRNATVRDEENSRGYRTDGKDLIQEWLNYDRRSKYIWNTTELLNIDPNDTDYLLGLFESTHMRYYVEVVEEDIHDLEPSLTQMTETAIDILSKNPDGYFLFVEGGRIDLGHHGTYLRITLGETAEFSRAIDAALKKVNLDDTLIVVTADHSHTMTYSGYAERGSDIFGPAGISNVDNLPYMTLSYSNGPGYSAHRDLNNGGRIDPTSLNTSPLRYAFPAMIPKSTETHAGEDVTVYATGPWSHLFVGLYEQNVIPHLMAYAACIGDGQTACDN